MEKFIGIKAFTYDSGIGVISMNSDTVVSAFIHPKDDELISDSKRETKVYYTSSGRPYFRRFGHKHYFDEFMRN